MKIEVVQSRLDGLLALTPVRVFPDARGFLVETYREDEWSAVGLPRFVQENHSRSVRGVLRGIHLSTTSGGQGKLVRCARGRIWDVAVDLRRGSPTFGQWEGFELSDENHVQVYIPPFFGHGFCVLSDVADVSYKLTQYYDGAHEHGVRWDDADLGIDWPLERPIVSERDATNPPLRELRDRLEARGI